MIKVIQLEIPLYEQMGVFTEAPKRKKKKKRIVKASAPSSLKDFTDGIEPDEIIDVGDIELDDIDPEDMNDLTTGYDDDGLEDTTIQSDDTGEEDYDDLDFTSDSDFTAGIDDEIENDEVQNQENPETVPTDEPVNTADDTPVTDEEQEVSDTTDEPNVDTGEQPVEGDTGTELDLGDSGTEDFTADAMDPSQQATDTTTPDATTTDPNAQQSATKDDMRKFVLYKKYMSLYNSIDNYLEKIDNIRLDNMAADKVRREVITGFNDIQMILRDYMIIKYSSDSYVQCILMYEKMRTAVLLLFEKVKVIIHNKKQ